MADDQKNSKKPVMKEKMKGISASTFENYSEGKDTPFYKTQLVRTYWDKTEKTFVSIPTYSRDELPLVAMLAVRRWWQILEHEQKARDKERKEQEE
jgi:hypothetical protein